MVRHCKRGSDTACRLGHGILQRLIPGMIIGLITNLMPLLGCTHGHFILVFMIILIIQTHMPYINAIHIPTDEEARGWLSLQLSNKVLVGDREQSCPKTEPETNQLSRETDIHFECLVNFTCENALVITSGVITLWLSLLS